SLLPRRHQRPSFFPYTTLFRSLAGERLGIIGRHKVTARREGQPLGADPGRDHGFLHRERFEDLEARSATRPERHDVDSRLRDKRSEEHTSELQSLTNLVFPLLL